MYKNVEDNKGNIIDNMYCTNEGELRSIDYDLNNYIIKRTENDKIELLFFPKGFYTPKHTEYNGFVDDIKVNYDVERITGRRRFKQNADGQIVPIRDDACISDLINLMKNGHKRTINNFFDFALNNKWDYFCTFTFGDEKVRYSRERIYEAWDIFRRGLQRENKDVKAIAVYEPHEKGGLHLHSLIGNVDLPLKPGRNPDTGEFVYSKASGVQVFNCLSWKNGYSNICCLDPKIFKRANCNVYEQVYDEEQIYRYK